MSEHFDLYCKYGYKHGTCRCPATNKARRRCDCKIIAHAENPTNDSSVYIPKHRKET